MSTEETQIATTEKSVTEENQTTDTSQAPSADAPEVPMTEGKLIDENDYMITLNRGVIYLSLSVLFGVLCAALSILTSTSTPSSNNKVVYVFFIGVIVVALMIKYFGFFGIITAFVGSLLFCVALKTEFWAAFTNVAINVFQALLLYLAFFVIKKFRQKHADQDDKKTAKNTFMILQLSVGLAFTCCGLLFADVMMIVRGFAIAEVVLYIVYSVIVKKWDTFLYLALVCFAPAFLAGSLNGSLQFALDMTQKLETVEVWLLSNLIILSSLGYVFIEYFKYGKGPGKLSFTTVEIRVTTMIFFAVGLLWNLVFFCFYYIGWLGNIIIPYLLPWLVGNVLLLVNMHFNSKIEVEGKEKSKVFKWYEERAVVAEKNTQFFISIITFLLPISSSLFGKTLGTNIITLFCINITCACLAIGLIWVPSKEIKTMSMIKTLKTVFHLLTISFLILSATMIIVPSA